ncbi:MAG: hypothetical protein GX347_08630 [Epulopiscium sp.]|nr:hypothetical protein [Candidatus Epulonipiscium sp.]
MGLIGINELTFFQTMSGMRLAGNAIDAKITGWRSQGERSKAFSAFVYDYNVLQNIIREYKRLVLKDINTIDKVGKDIVNIDYRLVNMWR